MSGNKKPVKIAVDAMGGDFAPLEVVKGCIEAVRKNRNVELQVVGDADQINKIINDAQIGEGDLSSRLRIVHASQSIGMHESPIKALREKKDSSISVAVNLVKQGEADGIVSLGNTGVLVAAATLKLRLLDGVKRAGIAIPLPTFGDGPCVALDMGANVNCKGENLLQYALMGSIYSHETFGVKSPKVGLLNIGEETEKGNDLVKESFSLLESANINFGGNIEGREIYKGDFDVFVCDGFVGNVVLKTSEGLVDGIMKSLKAEMGKSLRTKIGAGLALPAFKALKSHLDHTEYGGAILLGVKGVVIVGHGSSNAFAAYNAIRCGIEAVQNNINEKIIEAVKQ